MMLLRTSLRSIKNVLNSKKSWCTSQSMKRYSSIENSANNDYDIIITGGGMVGTSMLCALAGNDFLKGQRVLLLERDSRISVAEPLPTYSNRVVALNLGTIKFLSEIGVWEKVLSKRAKSVQKMQVWESCSESLITFNNENMADEVAFIVENNILLSAITEKYESIKSENNDIFYQTSVADYKLPSVNENENDKVTVELANGQVLNTRLLVGADGATSRVRDKMNVKHIKWNYDQSAIVATLRLSETGENVTAWQRFLQTGPVALLPLTDELSSLVWSTTKSECKRLLKMTDEQFVDTLNSAIWDNSKKNAFVESAAHVMSGFLDAIMADRLSILQLPPSIMSVVENSRGSFPLSLGHASNYVVDGVALVGDAAHKVHPLAGQGVNLGFGDVKCLVDLLSRAVYDGCPLNDIQILRQYETIRQRHVVPTMIAIDGLNRLYSTDFTPAVLIRSLGLQVTNSVPFLKNAVSSVLHAVQFQLSEQNAIHSVDFEKKQLGN
ncbi:Ubiquinone biosynthesis monooxygenase COQ6, mitochondrial [Nymphon striatum]|nr:Ubiquinone biosynthesis monooxygenase COQ6, mitochondrial [Nymphon striatum]